MGIPRLTQHLEPHATKVLLSHQSQDGYDDKAAKRQFIIDGPALAYHIYYVCMSRRVNANNAFDAIPFYRELGDTVVSWLRQLEQYGISISMIFFDGLLPPEKKAIRLSRLQQSTNLLVNFKAMHRADLPGRNVLPSTSATTHLRNPSSSITARSLSASPFLVPAIIEALSLSQYSSCSSVVPGEADAYCADMARTGNYDILTSDSDLLVHDLGPEGRVILFKDLESLYIANKGRVLRVLEYHPAGIATKMGLPSLVKPAFYLSEDPHRGLSDAIRLAKEQDTDDPGWSMFKKLYGELHLHSRLASRLEERKCSVTLDLLARLDPRTSEVLHQISLHEITSSSTSTSPEKRIIDVFLLSAHDDPYKTSSWRAGASIRDVAYALLALVDPTIKNVDEHERKGTRIGITTVLVRTQDLLRVDAIKLSEKIRMVQSKYSSLSLSSQWRALAAETVYELCLENMKQLPHDTEMSRVVLGVPESILTWSLIHCSAQVQAVLYSLRTLRQILEVVLSIVNGSNLSIADDLNDALRELELRLGSLPGVADVIEGGEEFDAYAEAWQTVYSSLRRLGGRSDQENEPTSKAKKKRKKLAAPKEGQLEAKWKSSNPFAALDD